MCLVVGLMFGSVFIFGEVSQQTMVECVVESDAHADICMQCIQLCCLASWCTWKLLMILLHNAKS